MKTSINDSSANITLNDKYERLDWIIPVYTNIVLIATTIWILISLIHYGIKTKKWRKVRKTDYVKLHAGVVYGSVVLCSVMCIFRYASSMAAMNTGFGIDKDQLCDRIADTAYCAYALVLFNVGLFLWLQQTTFYTNKIIKVSYKCIKLLSFVCIFLIVALFLFVVIYNTIPMNYVSTKKKCIYQYESIKQSMFWIIATGAGIMLQCVLLCLFAYALLRVKPSVRATYAQRYSINSNRQSQNLKKKPNAKFLLYTFSLNTI